MASQSFNLALIKLKEKSRPFGKVSASSIEKVSKIAMRLTKELDNLVQAIDGFHENIQEDSLLTVWYAVDAIIGNEKRKLKTNSISFALVKTIKKMLNEIADRNNEIEINQVTKSVGKWKRRGIYDSETIKEFIKCGRLNENTVNIHAMKKDGGKKKSSKSSSKRKSSSSSNREKRPQSNSSSSSSYNKNSTQVKNTKNDSEEIKNPPAPKAVEEKQPVTKKQKTNTSGGGGGWGKFM